MPKNSNAKKDIDFLKLFKKSLALSFTALIFGVQTSYASDITGDSKFNTNINNNGNIFNITGGYIPNTDRSTGFHHFGSFVLSEGDIANLIFNAGVKRYVNLVDGQVNIGGIFNAMQSGSIGGDVIFVSPQGMIVGASGIMNVGSLQTITPAQSDYNSLISNPRTNTWSKIERLNSNSTTSSTVIQGKIFSKGNITINDGQNIRFGNNSALISGFNDQGFAKTNTADFNMSDIVNSNGVVDAAYMSNSAGSIKITANDVMSSGRGGILQATTDIGVNTGDGGAITLGAKINAGRNVDLGQTTSAITGTRTVNINNDIVAGGAVRSASTSSFNLNSKASINAGGSVDISSFDTVFGGGITAGDMKVSSNNTTVNSDITTKNGFKVNVDTAGASFTQADDAVITNTDTGSIVIKVRDAETAKITNNAANGDIELLAGLKMKDTIKAADGNIFLTGVRNVTQVSDDFVGLDAAKDLNIVADADIGNSTQGINVKVGGDVSVTGSGSSDIYLSGKELDLNVSNITNTNVVSLSSDKAVNIAQEVTANDYISINATEGIKQSADSVLTAYGEDGVILSNSTSGDIVVNDVIADIGSVSVENNAQNGNVEVNGNVSAESGYVSINSAGGYSQNGGIINAGGVNSDNNSVVISANGEASIGEVAGTGDIKLSAGTVLLNNLIQSKTGNINVDATDSILQNGTSKTLEANGSVNLNAQKDIGSKEQNVVVSANTGVIANAVDGSVNLTGDNTNIELKDISANESYRIVTTGDGDIVFNKELTGIKGDLSLTTDKSLAINSGISADGDVTLVSNKGDVILNALITSLQEGITISAEGNIYQDSAFTDITLNAAKNINLSAATGDIGATGSYIQMISKGLVDVEGGNVYLQSPETLNIANINSSKTAPATVVSVKTTDSSNGNINIKGGIKGGNVTLDAAQGITQDFEGKTIDATGDLSLFARTESIGEQGKAVNFSANSVSAEADKSVVLLGIDTDINTSSIVAGENIDLSTQVTSSNVEKGKIIIANDLNAANGYVRLDSAKVLEINNDITAGKSITLSANGGITQSPVANIISGTLAGLEAGGGDITISNGTSGNIVLNSVVSNNGKISVTNSAAGADIVLDSVLVSTDSDIVLDSKGNIVQSSVDAPSLMAAGDIVINAINVGTQDKNLLLNANGSLSGTVNNLYVKDINGDLTLGVLNIGNSAFITADGNIVQADNTKDSIVSAGEINLVSTNGNIGADAANGVSVNITGDGRVNANAQNIYLNGTNISTGVLNASNDVSLNSVAQNGVINIKDNINANGNIAINSANGINHTNGTISRGSAPTPGSIVISSNSGEVSLKDVVNNNGEVRITSGEGTNVVLNSLISSANGDITIISGGGISQTIDGLSLSSDGNISLTGRGSIGSSAVTPVILKTTGGDVTAISHNGSIYLKADGTNLYASNISANNGNIDLTVTGDADMFVNSAMNTDNGYIRLVTDKGLNIENLISATGDITLDAKGGAITQVASLEKALNSGQNITVSAFGDIGEADNSLTLNANGDVNAKGQNVYLSSPDKTLNLASIESNGKVDINTTTSGDINLKGLVKGSDVTLNAADGIYQTVDGKTIDATGTLDLRANRESIGEQNRAINFSAASILADAEKSVVLLGEDVDINTSTIHANENIDLSTRVTDPDSDKGNITVASDLTTTNGYIRLDSAKGLNIDKNLNAGKFITLIANGDILLNSIVTAGSEVTLDSAGAITRGDNTNASINAGTDVTLNAVNNIGSIDKAINLTANGLVNATGSEIYLSSLQQTINLDTINSTGDVKIATGNNGDINIKTSVSGDNITLEADGGIYQESTTKTITAQNALNLKANTKDIGTTEKAIRFQSGTIKAEAPNGSVVLVGENTNINTSSIVAKNNIDLSTNGSGNITVAENIEANGYIRLNSAEELNVNKDLTSRNSYIELGAAKGLTLASQIEAATDVRINTTGGVNQTAGSIVANTGSVNVVNSNSGDVSLNGITAGTTVGITNNADSQLSVHNVNAQNGVTVLNNGTENANVLAGGITTASGNVSVQSLNGDVVLDSLIESTVGDISLAALGSVTQNFNGKALQAGNDITLTAKGNVGSDAQSIVLNNNGILNADASNVFISNNETGLNLGLINASNNIKLNANGNIVQANAGNASVVAGGNIDLTANGSGSSIGESKDNTLIVDSQGVVNAAADNIYLSSNNTLNTGRINSQNNAYVKTNGDNKDIVIKDFINGSNVELNASGSVFQDSELSKTIEAGTLKLTAVNGSIGQTGNAIDFSAPGALSADAAQAVVLNGVGRDIDTSSIHAGTSIDLSTENSGKIIVSSDLVANNGYIRLNSVDGLELNQNLTATDYITLISQTGDILLNSIVDAGSEVTLDSAGAITRGDNALASINAGTDVTLNAVNNIGSLDKAINLTANGLVNATGSEIYLSSLQQTINLDTINSTGDVKITTGNNGDINIKTAVNGDNVTLEADGGIYQESTSKTITAQNALNLKANTKDIGTTDKAIRFESESLKAEASNGSVVLVGENTDINTNSIVAKNNIDLSTNGSGNITVAENIEANGYIRLNSAEELNVNKDLTSSNSYIELGAAKGLTLASQIEAATDVRINTSGGVNQTAGSIVANTGNLIVNNNTGAINITNAIAGDKISVTNNDVITLSGLTAENGISVNNNGTAPSLIVIGGSTTNNGNIAIENISGGNVVISSAIEATKGDVGINAGNGNILQNFEGESIIAGNDINLKAADVGTETAYLNTNAGNVVNADGVNIYLQSDKDVFNIGSINGGIPLPNATVNLRANTGDVNIKNLVGGNEVNISAARNITQDSSLSKSIDANKLTLNAENGTVGTNGNALNIKVNDRVDVTNSNDVYLNGVETDLNAGNINAANSVNITADNGLNLKGLIKTSEVNLTANGDIKQDSSLRKSVESDSLKLISNNGSIGETGNAIDFSANSLRAEAANGSVVLNGVETDISTNTILAGSNIDLSTEGSGSITVADAITTNGYIRLNSAEGLVVDKNLTGGDDIILVAQNGDVVLSALAQSLNGDVSVTSDTGSILQTIDGLTLSSKNNMLLSAANTLGSLDNALKVSAGGNIDLNATDVYLTGLNSSLNIASVNQNRTDKTLGTVNLKTTGDDSNININDSINVNSLDVTSSNDLNLNKAVSANTANLFAINNLTVDANVAAQNGLTISGGSIVQNLADSVISNTNGELNITASNGDISLNGSVNAANGLLNILNNSANGDILLNGSVNNQNGIVNIVNNASNGLLTVNNVNAGDSYSIINNANGLLTINGIVSGNSDSVISALNAGNESGLVIGENAVLNNNNGTLTVTNKGKKGLKFNGVINNNRNDATRVDLISDNGGVAINGIINNGQTKGAANTVNVINNGKDENGNGLVFENGVINNFGNLKFENNDGSMIIAGQLNSELASTNTFINGSDDDFNINSVINADGNTVTLENRGSGSLIVDENAILSVNSVRDGQDVYTGILNLLNTSDSGKIAINGIINGGTQGFINITNEATGANSSIDFNGNSSINAGGNSVSISNSGQGGINLRDNANISGGNSINIVNKAGSVNIDNDASVHSGSTLTVVQEALGNSVNINGLLHGSSVDITSNNSDINIAHNKQNGNIIADNDVTINAQNADILNSSSVSNNEQGIVAGGTISLNAKNIGVVDSTVNNIINDGFNLDSSNSIHLSANNIIANSQGDLNLLAVNGDLNISELSAVDALIAAVNGNIAAHNAAADNLYAYAQGDNASINADGLNVNNLTAEAGGRIDLNSDKAINIDSLLSRNDSIKINSEGNTEINEIAAANDITVNVNDEKLTVINLGKVQRAENTIPKTVNLTVNDAKNVSDNKNGKLDIYNAYVQDKVTLKADTITAQVYDISDSSVKGQKRVDKFGNEATGFHNANKSGKLLEFDIQGANTIQEDAGSNPFNSYYTPDENDKRAQSVHLTIGDSVGDAEYGANFKKLYSDYAFIDSINNSNPDAVSKIRIESGIIGEYGIIRNNKNRLDIANSPLQDFPINKHYDDAPDKTTENKTSFNTEVYEEIKFRIDEDDPDIPDPPNPPGPGPDPGPDNPGVIDPVEPSGNPNVDPATGRYNPHRDANIDVVNLDSKTKAISAKDADNSAVKEGASTGLRNINWVIRKDRKVIGASETKLDLPVDALLSISKTGLSVLVDEQFISTVKKGDKLHIDLKYKEIAFNVDGKVSEIKGKTAKINFINADRLTSKILLMVGMSQESL